MMNTIKLLAAKAVNFITTAAFVLWTILLAVSVEVIVETIMFENGRSITWSNVAILILGWIVLNELKTMAGEIKYALENGTYIGRLVITKES